MQQQQKNNNEYFDTVTFSVIAIIYGVSDLSVVQ